MCRNDEEKKQQSPRPAPDGAGRTICLIRHGKPEGAALGRCIGHMDVLLSEEGRANAHGAADWLKRNMGSFALWSSPLSRCLETARIIQAETGCGQVRLHRGLTEVAAGIWEGLTYREIQDRYPEEYARRCEHFIHHAPPGGESFFEAGRRFEQAILEIASEDGTDPIVICAHSGVMQSLLCRLGAESFDRMITIRLPYASATIIKAQPMPDGRLRLSATDQIGLVTDSEAPADPFF